MLSKNVDRFVFRDKEKFKCEHKKKKLGNNFWGCLYWNYKLKL